MSKYLRRLNVTVATLNSSRMDFGYVSRWPQERDLGPDPRRDGPATADAVRDLLKTRAFDVVIPLFDPAPT